MADPGASPRAVAEYLVALSRVVADFDKPASAHCFGVDETPDEACRHGGVVPEFPPLPELRARRPAFSRGCSGCSTAPGGRSARDGADLDTLLTGLDALGRVAEELLDVRRLERGRFAIAPAPLDLVAVARGAAEAVADEEHPVEVADDDEEVCA